MSKSVRHHFVPQFYLRNFLSERSGSFFVYDKKGKGNKISVKSPKQVCYENHRNSFFGKENIPVPFLEEKTYTIFDRKHSESINFLAKTNDFEEIWTKNNVENIEFFISLLHWRLPSSDSKLDHKIKVAERVEDFGLTISTRKSQKIINDLSFHKEILQTRDFRTAVRINLAVNTFMEEFEKHKSLEWRLFALQGYGNFLTTDNPMLFKLYPQKASDLRSEVILPISQNRALIRIDENHPSVFPKPAFINLMLIDQAERFIISPNKLYLEECIKVYHQLKENGEIDNLKSKLWNF
ncbi:DUF4238 domain-containing protein [Litoribacter ruber]|uniref:DUF4238 domain-containing protein n=1 Tax=Litoribacter ruber TaxID=702568 RepID=UPI001BDAD60D|nr:DUF4238 domain-containing protein [Litoribacter ruber]MBT0813023.1 DUF4238 domain-containing protein [Litoribacter ruber]